MNEQEEPVLVFRVGDQRFAVEARVVESVENMVAITSLPRGPDVVRGIIDVGGEIVPVCSIRRRFGMPDRLDGGGDFLILVRTSKRLVAVGAEEIEEVRNAGPVWRDREGVGAPRDGVAGVIRSPDGLILIQNLDLFLHPPEEALLEEALKPKEAES